MKKFNLILLLLGFGFLGYLIWRVGPVSLARQVADLGWGVVFLIAVEGLANLAHTLGWRHCIARGNSPVPLRRLFHMATAGYAINYVTPTASVGGDVTRAVLLSANVKGPDAASSVLLDKLMTAMAHLILVFLGAIFLFGKITLPTELWVAMAISTGLLSTGMIVFLMLQKFGKLGSVCRWLVDHHLGGRFVEQAASHLSKVDESLKEFYRKHPGDLALSVGWHFIGHSAAITQAWIFLVLLGQPAALATVAAAGILSLWFDLLTFAIPLNLGTLEASRILVFKSLGCQALLGMTFALAVRIAQVFWVCFGLLSYTLLADLRSDIEPFTRLRRWVGASRQRKQERWLG
jgi:uncharacterized protein (TIRG00374 family)